MGLYAPNTTSSTAVSVEWKLTSGRGDVATRTYAARLNPLVRGLAVALPVAASVVAAGRGGCLVAAVTVLAYWPLLAPLCWVASIVGRRR
jgi:hypothetical protein